MPNPLSERLFAEGVSHHRQGNVAQAGAAYARACEADATHLAAQFNLAVTLQAQGRDLDAESAYKKALALKPDLVQALNNLGNLYLAHNRVAEALSVLMRATKATPEFAPPWNNLGNALLRMGRTQEAATHFGKAVERDATFSEARTNLAQALLTLGRPAEALPHLEMALTARPNDVSLRFLRDAAAGATPARPPDEFVAHLFDGMAAEFDERLIGKLGYRVPDRLADVLGEWLDSRARPRRVLDLGCGTGLMADALRGRFEEIRGVDLSPNMVAQARARKLYTEVRTGDLVAFLAECPDESADLLVAADVFVYVGDLAAVFAQARRVLATGGRLAFSVEGGARGDDFALGATGRYSHADGYVRALATANAFTVAHASAETLRAERGSPVGGRLYMLA